MTMMTIPSRDVTYVPFWCVSCGTVLCVSDGKTICFWVLLLWCQNVDDLSLLMGPNESDRDRDGERQTDTQTNSSYILSLLCVLMCRKDSNRGRRDTDRHGDTLFLSLSLQYVLMYVLFFFLICVCVLFVICLCIFMN